MQKNWFGIVGRFSLPRLLALSAVVVWWALPPLALVLPIRTPGLAGLAWVGPAALLAATFIAARWMRLSRAAGLLPWVGLLAVSWMMLRSGVIGWRTGGITWRGRLYPSAMLRASQRVIL